MPPRVYRYALERLYQDQDFDWVVDAVPAVLAWVPGRRGDRQRQPFNFRVRHALNTGSPWKTATLRLTWDAKALQQYDSSVLARAERFRSGRTVNREQVTELAAYGLAMVAISLFFPGQRVKDMPLQAPPDLLLDETPNALRGVEVAGRSVGGMRKLEAVMAEKRADLLLWPEITEVWLSLWCASPRLALLCKVKP